MRQSCRRKRNQLKCFRRKARSEEEFVSWVYRMRGEGKEEPGAKSEPQQAQDSSTAVTPDSLSMVESNILEADVENENEVGHRLA